MNDTGSKTPNRSWPNIVLVALIIISFIRVAPLVVWFDDLQQDPDAYAALAEGWAASGTFGRISQDANGRHYVYPTAYRPPLYPYLLSWLTHLDYSQYDAQQQIHPHKLSRFAVALLHWILGVGTCWLTIQVALVITNHHALSVLSGLCVAVDPILLRQSSLLMTETLATFLAVAFLYWWSKSDFNFGSLFVGGVLLGLSILCRPTAAIWVASLTIWWGISLVRRNSNISLRQTTFLLATVALTITPWVIRNLIVFEKPIWATTHGGYTLLLANNPIIFDHFEKGSFSREWDEEKFHRRWAKRMHGDPSTESFWMRDEHSIKEPVPLKSPDRPWLSELKEDQLAHDAAMATIKRHPWSFALSIPTRIGWLWAFWPSLTQSGLTSTLLIGFWYATFFIGLIILAAIHGKPTSENLQTMYPALLLIASLTLVHSIYWSNMRMRSVAMPSVYVVFASLLASRLRTHFRP